MPTEKETLEAEIADLKRQASEREALEPLRVEAERLRAEHEDWKKSVSKPATKPAPAAAVAAPAADGGFDLNDITGANMQDSKKASAAAAAIRKALAELAGH